MKAFNLFGGVAFACLLAIAMPAHAGSINGMQQVVVCDPTTNNGQNCIKPLADGSINVNGGGGGGGGGAVYGPTATGGAAANPPVIVGGTINGGAAGNVQGAAMKAASTAPAATDPALVVALSPNGAQATSALQGTGNSSLGTIATNTTGVATAANQTAVTGSKAPGTAAASSQLVGGVYNSSDPTLTNGQQASAQLTSKGEVRNHDTDLLAAAQAGTAATGGAAPASAIYMGANSGGNLTGIIQADTSKKMSISTATTTEVIALAASKKVYITAWDIVANGTATFKLVYGTGTNCGTGTTDLTDAYDLTAQAGLSKGSGLGPVLIAPSGNAVCMVDSASVHMGGSIAYTQAP